MNANITPANATPEQFAVRASHIPPSIALADLAWQETGPAEDPSARLLAPITIAQCSMHLEAFAIKDSDEQRFVINDHDGFGGDEEAFYSLTNNAVQTVDINGREYALLATPYGA